MDYVVIATVVLGVVGLYLLFVYLKKRGFTNGQLDLADDIVSIARKVISVFGFSETTKNVSTIVLDIADKVVDYVQDLSEVSEVSDKAVLSETVVDEVLSILGIDYTDKEKSLIKIVIEEGIEFFDKQATK